MSMSEKEGSAHATVIFSERKREIEDTLRFNHRHDPLFLLFLIEGLVQE